MRSAFPGLFILLFLTFTAHCQIPQAAIGGCVPEVKGKQVFLEAFLGSEDFLVDSCFADANGCFTLTPPLHRPGLYRVLFPQKRFMDVIFRDKEVSFTSSLNRLIDSTIFTDDADNQLYYNYLTYRLQFSQVTHDLRNVLKYSDTSGTSFKSARKEYLQLQREDSTMLMKFRAQQPASLASRLMEVDQHSGYDPLWSKAVKDEYLFEHFLDYADFTDTTLLYTNALSAKIISFLDLTTKVYKDTTLNEGFLEASYRLLAATGNNSRMFEFVQDYLEDGFERLAFHALSDSLGKVPNPCCKCSTQPTENQTYNKPSALNKLPKITLHKKGKKIRLPKNGTSYLILFVKEDCPWNQKMREEFNTALLSGQFSGHYLPIVVSLNAALAQSPKDNNFQLSSKSLKKLNENKLLDGNYPEIWVVDEAGTIQKILPNFIIFRRWLWSQLPS